MTSQTVRIALLSTVDGGYAPAGLEQRRGFELFLATEAGTLGGCRVELIHVAEGAIAPFADVAAENTAALLAKRPDVTAVVGGFHAATTATVYPLTKAKGVPFIATNARPIAVDDIAQLWHTGQLLDEAPAKLGAWLAANRPNDSVHIAGFDSPALAPSFAAFRQAFQAGGGVLAGETYFPSTTLDFEPYVEEIAASGAHVIYAFGAMTPGVLFVRHVRRHLGPVEIYGPGWLTETVLETLGVAAVGITTASFYHPALPESVNQTFVSRYRQRYGATPSSYAVASYDAAAVLDMALAKCETITPPALNEALAAIGDVPSPRGPWRFTEDHSPSHGWHLRTVRATGDTVAEELVGSL